MSRCCFVLLQLLLLATFAVVGSEARWNDPIPEDEYFDFSVLNSEQMPSENPRGPRSHSFHYQHPRNPNRYVHFEYEVELVDEVVSISHLVEKKIIDVKCLNEDIILIKRLFDESSIPLQELIGVEVGSIVVAAKISGCRDYVAGVSSHLLHRVEEIQLEGEDVIRLMVTPSNHFECFKNAKIKFDSTMHQGFRQLTLHPVCISSYLMNINQPLRNILLLRSCRVQSTPLLMIKSSTNTTSEGFGIFSLRLDTRSWMMPNMLRTSWDRK